MFYKILNYILYNKTNEYMHQNLILMEILNCKLNGWDCDSPPSFSSFGLNFSKFQFQFWKPNSKELKPEFSLFLLKWTTEFNSDILECNQARYHAWDTYRICPIIGMCHSCLKKWWSSCSSATEGKRGSQKYRGKKKANIIDFLKLQVPSIWAEMLLTGQWNGHVCIWVLRGGLKTASKWNLAAY